VSFVNFDKKEINFKIVYYGPPLCGKTTNLEYLHRVMPPEVRGDMTMLSTRQDRTLYFDFLPLESRAIKGYISRFQLYTVPGQPMYNQTRRIVLTGVDGIVFVADSQWDKMEDNAESFRNMEENLRAHKRALAQVPYVLQFNKRDLADVAPVTYLDFLLNQKEPRAAYFETVATEGTGVADSLNRVCKMVMAHFIAEHQMSVDELTSKSNVAVQDA
jgi:signal recognition particle receptor subunit beta